MCSFTKPNTSILYSKSAAKSAAEAQDGSRKAQPFSAKEEEEEGEEEEEEEEEEDAVVLWLRILTSSLRALIRCDPKGPARPPRNPRLRIELTEA